ncbi:piggyBac transposable element-derived protein 3-like [Coccinella septempunctata]|uniref:piggyBac transposable element-derived protein 3-like n=1 Tax=Coccinella septempunctata TaxID=41139 RepID=UPI001D06905D|nr:piggyBac transposable element-derived protein 3-like [Coccinella septempunctata]
MYWEARLEVPLIANSMQRNQFYKLRQHLHFVDNLEKPNNNDRFWKVRPLFDSIRNKCLTLPLELSLSIGEQIVPFKGKLDVKQYVKGKPCPWGIKIFALCGASGLLYDFLLYQGSTTELDETFKKHLGLGAAVVWKLAERISEENIQLYYHNYFSNYQLLQCLRQKQIWASGTARLDRFKAPLFSSDKVLQAKGRGTSEELISGDGEVILTRWYDNKAVNMASNFMGIGETYVCKRWDKKQKQYVYVTRPKVVQQYNLNMGGVDKLDFLVSLYRSFIRTKKWTLRMFTHGIDLACVNAWLQYRSKTTALGLPKKQILDLLHFRAYVGEALILLSKSGPRKRGRPSVVTDGEPQTARSSTRPRPEVRTLDDIRFDGMNHLPEVDEKR